MPCSHSVVLPCSYSHCLPPPPCTSRPAAARASHSAAPRLTPCCSLHVAPCCPARRALLQPARRALLQPARRALLQPASRALLTCGSCPATASLSRPTTASASRPAALRVAPCYSQRVAPYCSQRVVLCCPARRALLPCPPRALRPTATTATAAARATVAAGAGAARGGQRRSLPLPDDPTPQQLREWVLQQACLGGGGFGFLRTAQRRQQSQQGTFSPQVLSEMFPQRCVTGSVEAAALGDSESAAALGGSESAAALGSSVSSAALGARASPATGPSSAEALHTFTLDSGASRCYFRDCTTLTPLAPLVPVSLADPTGGPVVARASTVLPCPGVPSGSLSGLHLPTFSTNLVSNAAIQDVWVDTFIPGGLRVAICTMSGFCVSGSSLYTLTTASAQVAEAGEEAPLSGVCVWSACSILLVSGTLPPDSPLAPPPRSPLPTASLLYGLLSPCLWPSQIPALPPEARLPRRAFPASRGGSSLLLTPLGFSPTTAPLQTLHIDVWGPAPIGGTDQERYFLLVVDDYTRYTTVFPLRRKADVSGVLIPWIRATHRQLCERFSRDFPVLRLHSDMGVQYTAHQLNLWPRGSAPLGVSQVDPPPLVEPLEVSFDSCGPGEGGDPAADDTAATHRSPRLETPPGFLPRPSSPPPHPAAVDSGAETAGAEPGGAKTEGEGSRGAATGGAGFGGPATGGAGSWGAATGGADSGGPTSPSGGGAVGDPTGGPGAGQPQQPDLLEMLSPQAIRAAGAGGTRGAASVGGAGATSPRGATSAGGAGPTSPGGTAGERGAGGAAGARGAGAGGTGGAGDAGPGGARTGGARAAGAGGVVRAGGATGAAGSGGIGGTACAGGAGAGGTEGTGGAGVAGRGGARIRGNGAARAGGAAGAGGATGATGTGGVGGTTGARGPGAAGPSGAAGAGGAGAVVGGASAGGASAAGVGGARAAGTHGMALRPSSVPQHAVLLEPPVSSLPHVSDPESDLAHTASPTVTRLLATVVTHPDLECTATFALVTKLVDFAARSRRDHVASLVTEFESDCPPSVGDELALGSDVLEDRQFELECLADALPRFASMLLCPKGDPDALDIPTPRSYAEVIAGEYSSQWHTAMDAEMVSWKSTGTYVDEVPPPGANIVDGMWIFRVKRPLCSLPAFKARYVA
ncbi:unnamed protein product [Closterium sp. NIES-54]